MNQSKRQKIRFKKLVELCNKNEIITYSMAFQEIGEGDGFNHRMRVYLVLRKAVEAGLIRRVRHGQYASLKGTGYKHKKKFVDMRLVDRLKKKGLPVVKIAKQLKISEKTLRRRLKE